MHKTLRRAIIISGVAMAMAGAPAAGNAFARTAPLAEKPVAAENAPAQKKDDGKSGWTPLDELPAWLKITAGATIIGVMIALVGSKPPKNREDT